jgi:hypothetical protein
VTKYTTPRSATVLVDPSGTRLGTATDPVVVTGAVVAGNPSVGPTGDPVPAEATLVGGENTLGDLEAPRVVATASGPGFVVSDPALTDGTQLAQVTGTGAAGVPAAGVVSVQGVAGGTPVPITGSISATNPSVGTNGAAIPTSTTQVGGEDGSGNLQAAQVLAGAPAGTERGIVTRNVPSGTQAVSAAALPLPAGAASLAEQQTQTTRLNLLGTEATLGGVLTTTAFENRINTQGQKPMAASTPVALASDQSPVPVTGTVTASNPSVGLDGAAAPASSTQIGGEDGSGNLQAAQVLPSAPAGTERGVITRNIPSGTQTVAGGLSNNVAAPTTGQLGVLPAVANAAAPALVEGRQALLSTDLSGALRITGAISASNPSVGTVGAVAPTSGTQVAGPDGSGNLAVPQVLTAEPVEATPGMAVRVVPGHTPFPVAAMNLQYLLNILAEVLGQAQDPAGRLRVLIDPIGGAQTLGTVTTVGTVTNLGTLATVTTVTTVSTVTNIAQVGGAIAASSIFDNMQTAWASSVRGRIT